MRTVTAVYIDFQCVASYRAWRWLSLVGVRSDVEVRPYSLDADGGERSPWDRTRPSTGLELLALGELARETGQTAHEAYVDAAFAAVHDQETDVSSVEAWLALGAKAGLDLDAFTADAERWRADVGYWHQEAADELGVVNTPTLVVDDEHAVYLRLSADPSEVEAGRRLLGDVVDLAYQPLSELRRTA